MSSTDFRQIAIGNDDGKPERLFRAAVSAFCSLTRPSRREIAQLEDLALSLYDQVSPESRRYVAAALSESDYAPAGLVRRLAAEDVDIAAPLLLRSSALGDAALISLIAQRGLPHARAIAHRPALDPAIAALIRALEASTPGAAEPVRPAAVQPQPPVLNSAAQGPRTRSNVVRDRLRAMMADAGAGAAGATGDKVAACTAVRYEHLRAAALSGRQAFFQTALADALDIGFADAGLLLSPERRDLLMRVLAGLGLAVEQAFLLVAAHDLPSFLTGKSIGHFVQMFQAIDAEAGRDEIRALRSARLSALTTRLRSDGSSRPVRA